MYLKRLKLHNFKCFEDLDMEFHDNLTVIVGSNGAGKTTILEGAAIAVSSLFVKMDGLTGRKIDRTQAHLKSYSVGSTKDVQEQYPVVVSAIAKDNQFLSGEDIESLYNTGKMLEHHDGTLTEEPVQEVKEEKPSIDDQDDLLDEMK